MQKFILYFLGLSLLLLSLTGCTEPYKLETTIFEEALVVEGLITNEMSYQKIKLSRIIRLEEDEANLEQNAQVWIEDSNHNRYDFSESELGVYHSNETFQAAANMGYTLFIQTADGNQYESREEFLTPAATISNVYAELETINGTNGIQIYVDSNEDVGSAQYFRYEYDETFKIITPYSIYLDVDLEVSSPYNFVVNVQNSTEQKQVCYTTKPQKEIIQLNNLNSIGNNITKFPVRFVKANDFMLSERYSILVKQYVQLYDSYNYYNTLKELGSVESLLIESQTGFIHGNISNRDNRKEKVIGFFEVSSLDTKRIYFNHADFGIRKPNYPFVCEIDTLDYRDATVNDDDRNERLTMYTKLAVWNPPWELLGIHYVLDGTDPWGNDLYVPICYLLKPQCGNCNLFSSNVKPEFWED